MIPIVEKKKVTGLRKNESGGLNRMNIGLGGKNKKAKGKKKCTIKKKPKFKDSRKCLEDNKIILKSKQKLTIEMNN